MRKEPSRKLFILVVLSALLVVILPLGVACDEANNNIYPKMNLIMTNTSSETESAGIAAKKFKELLALYTGGKVTVDLTKDFSWGRYFEQKAPEWTKHIDLEIAPSEFASTVNPNLYPIDYLPGIILNAEHGRAVTSDPILWTFLTEKYAEKNFHFLGYIETNIISGYLSSVELKDFNDMYGLNYTLLNYPFRNRLPLEMFGAKYAANPDGAQFFSAEPIIRAYDVLEFNRNRYTGGDSTYNAYNFNNFGYLLMQEVYSAVPLQMKLDTWNKMTPELQDLISNAIVPEVQQYLKNWVFEKTRNAVLGLKESLKAIHMASPESERNIWNMLQTQEDFLKKKVWLQQSQPPLDPAVSTLIDNLRPTNPTLAQETIDILTYAGFIFAALTEKTVD